MALASRHPIIPSSRHLLAIVLLFVVAESAQAHPVPKDFYDRTVVVRLDPDGVVVEYRLEVDDLTIWKDLKALDLKEINQITGAGAAYQAFTRHYGPILADNLAARLDGKPLAFTCVEHRHQVLDHIRCDFVFRAPWKLMPAEERKLTFQEGNYLEDKGRIDLALGASPAMFFHATEEPDAELKKRSALDLRPGDRNRLRRINATFELQPPEPAPEPREAGVSVETAPAPPPRGVRKLRDLLLNTDLGLAVVLLLAGAFGAAHALTPGHGKTLVAAYLVGEHGTIWHALLLGLVTTLTHTGAVIALAVLFLFIPALIHDAQVVLGFISGLLAIGVGFWLLQRRLSNRPDHIHFGGGHHHHHHDHDHHRHQAAADHYHDEHGNAHPVSARPPGVWGLLVLGVSGGLVPCVDAIILFVAGVKIGRPVLTLAALLAFSAGLAAVLVLIGVLVVTVKGFASSRIGQGRLVRTLPLVSAMVIMALGLWMCYDSLHPEAEPPPVAAGRP